MKSVASVTKSLHSLFCWMDAHSCTNISFLACISLELIADGEVWNQMQKKSSGQRFTRVTTRAATFSTPFPRSHPSVGFISSTLAPPDSAETHHKRHSWVLVVQEENIKDIVCILILPNSLTLQLGGIYHCRCGAWITAA